MIGTVITMTFVVGMLVLVGYVIFRLTPYARHADSCRDPETGERVDGGIHLWHGTDETSSPGAPVSRALIGIHGRRAPPVGLPVSRTATALSIAGTLQQQAVIDGGYRLITDEPVSIGHGSLGPGAP